MSFEHPTHTVNTCRRNDDPFDLLSWQQRHDTLAPRDQPIKDTKAWTLFFQWKHFQEDTIHFTPFDSLPKEDRDTIRARRLRAFQESRIPWLVSDYSEYAQALDDIDDMAKTATFIKEYAVTPLVQLPSAIRTLASDTFEDAVRDMREACTVVHGPRQRKLAFLNKRHPGTGSSLLLPALALLFPAWKFVALGLQALQTLDNFFGVGIQLGPIIAAAEEAFFRGLSKIGLPFGPENNKYHQLLAAGVTRRSARIAAIHRALHPEDVLTMLSAQHAASNHLYMPYLVIDPDHYPKATELFHDPATQLRNYKNLALSLPYNLAAVVTNNAIAPMFLNWSSAVNAQPPAAQPQYVPNSLERRIMATLNSGFCPGTHCNASVYQHFGIENTIAQRLDPISDQLIDAYHFFKSLLWHPPATPPTSVTPSPRGIF
jgi:hypothetical protein